MLDNVLDATYWPLAEQKAESDSKRRIGLGFTGLGDALIMLGLHYASDHARKMAATIAEEMRNYSYLESSGLAVEKSPFPLFDADSYLESQFVKRLPDNIKSQIKRTGMRNSHTMAIAPTGTISLAFADNASNGIEPPFSLTYNRKKRMPDGSSKVYPVEDYAYRLFRHMYGEDKPLPDCFATAQSISVDDHLKMLEAVSPYVDTATSKTVNVPADYPFEDFKGLYTRAWKAGLKGLATYRPNDTLGSVLEVAAQPPAAVPAELSQQIPTENSVRRWKNRPSFPTGAPSRTFATKATGAYFEVNPVFDENGRPFEVWVAGEGADPTTGALAMTLSLLLQLNDSHLALDMLNKLKDYHIRDGSFWEWDMFNPDKKRLFPSQVAYMASAVLYAYAATAPQNSVIKGKKCPDCGEAALVKKDGCEFCTACGYIGACG
jgi:ribonucleoside-diphosphate reductase alpha chain